MKVSKKNITQGVEILAAYDPDTAAQCIYEEGIIKAGMPITQDGKKAIDGAGAVGILLYDVDTGSNPNATLVVGGQIDWQKVKAYNEEVTVGAQEISNILPRITFREVVDGKTYVWKNGQ